MPRKETKWPKRFGKLEVLVLGMAFAVMTYWCFATFREVEGWYKISVSVMTLMWLGGGLRFFPRAIRMMR